MKTFLKKLAASLGLIMIALVLHAHTLTYVATAADDPVNANGSTVSPLERIQSIGTGTNLPDYETVGSTHPDAAPYLEGVAIVSSPILYAVDLFRYFLSGIALLMVVISAIRLVSTDQEDKAKEAKTSLIVGAIGLLVVQLADVVVKKMFFGEQGDAFENVATAKLYAEESVSQIRGIIGFVEAFLGAVAVFVIVLRGFILVTSVGDEEAIGKAKTHILYAVAGLIIVGIAELVVRGIIFPDAGDSLPDVNAGRKLIIQFTNYVSGFVALFSFLALFYGGYQYVVSAGNEEGTEKVKKIITGALIALLLSLGSFALVSTFIKLEDPVNVTTPAP